MLCKKVVNKHLFSNDINNLMQLENMEEPVPASPDVVLSVNKMDVNDTDEWPTPVIAVATSRVQKTTTQGDPPTDSLNHNGPLNSRQSVDTTFASMSNISPILIRRDAANIERGNMLALLKLVVKQLIDMSLSKGGILDDVQGPLLQFFTVFEAILCHAMKSSARKGLLRVNEPRDCWLLIERFSLFVSSSADILLSVKEMSNVRTSIGKLRAWLRLSLMQKTLVDYFRQMVDLKDKLLIDFYEPHALMLGEEAFVVSGLLIGLNIIDCNMVLKDDDYLDRPLDVIDYSLYLKEILISSSLTDEEKSHNDSLMASLIEQKNYLEELNRHLTTSISNLNQKLESIQLSNVLVKEELAVAVKNIEQLQNKNDVLRAENSSLSDMHKRHVQLTQQDMQTERETYQQAQLTLEALCQETKQRLRDEIQMRIDVEKELELQIGMKQEIEVALKFLEKDAYDKQDMIVSLRKQLEDVKSINIDISGKLQKSESSLQHKIDVVTRLEQKTGQMSSTIRDVEDSLKQSQAEKLASTETVRRIGQQLADKEAKRLALETDLKIEREWRGTLQKNLDQEKAKSAALQSDVAHLSEVKKEFDSLHSKYLHLQNLCDEQEKTLAELGSQLSQSKLKVEDLKEAQLVVKDAQWTEDKEATHCRQCLKMFSVSRRKHHCRNCGDIYCNDCSNVKVMLPSSSKPVRVCDTCNALLLQRCSAN